MFSLHLLFVTFVSGDTVVNLLLGDSSIGESDIRFRGKLDGSIIGVDPTATTYDVVCAVTGPIAFPFTTPACVGGDHVTITQGPSTMILSQLFEDASTSRNYRENCTFSNTDTVTCSILNTIAEVSIVGGHTITQTSTYTDSRINASPTNGPLYFLVTITAGLEKLTSGPTRSTPTVSANASQMSGSAVESQKTADGV
ncbi:hypothetical protein VTL71DRAFT_15726 [Oculimacula yallundae]|uniref:Uncharacterized protein n=1 Tax=Oculimacula yallundae TaxID=86028 RepID=A0ABR4CD06_9HELO